MTDEENQARAATQKRAWEILQLYTGMGFRYRERCYRAACTKLADPGGVIKEIDTVIRAKKLKGEAAARYMFVSIMGECQ